LYILEFNNSSSGNQPDTDFKNIASNKNN